MPRCFVAAILPDAAKEALLAVQPAEMRGLRLITRDELHLTMHFLGEISAEDVDLVKEALASIEQPAFGITLRGLGLFRRRGRPTILWAGIEPSESLQTLHGDLGAALRASTGFEPETRPYSPHITLGRVKQRFHFAEALEDHVEAHAGFALDIPLDRFALMITTFAENMPHYREAAAFLLK